MSHRPYVLEPQLARPNFGGVISETDWIAETFVTGDELVRCIHGRHTDAPNPDPCALWRAKEAP